MKRILITSFFILLLSEEYHGTITPRFANPPDAAANPPNEHRNPRNSRRTHPQAAADMPNRPPNAADDPPNAAEKSLQAAGRVTCGNVLDMMPDAFDDQYLGCESKMDEAAVDLLQKEKSNPQFNTSWEKAKSIWKTKAKYVNITGFKEEYGTAVVLYTMETPIYRWLNGNVSIAGKSTDYYTKQFHLKALHFYLTRALQLLARGCKQKLTTYRGSNIAFTVSAEMRFGQFASSSRNKTEAEGFGIGTLFTISTCLGANIEKLSVISQEQEVLIPVFEKFQRVSQKGKLVTLQSTGQRCSYFNCAYLGGQKRSSPVCNG